MMWRKPKDVNEPVSIDISEAEAAYLLYDRRFKRLERQLVQGTPRNGARADYGKWAKYIPSPRKALILRPRARGAEPKGSRVGKLDRLPKDPGYRKGIQSRWSIHAISWRGNKRLPLGVGLTNTLERENDRKAPTSS
jgi:hypothetical protein